MAVMISAKLLMMLLLLKMSLSYYGIQGGRTISPEEDLEFERQLKILNKPPVKTFQMEEGDIVDCIDFYKQPAFDNPLLKNHKIKTKPRTKKPRTYPKGSSYRRSSSQSSTSVQSLGNAIRHFDCPEGTVPIRRTSKEDLIRAKYFSKTFKAGSIRPLNGIVPGQQLAIHHSYNITPAPFPLPYYGIQAHIKIDKPSVLDDQFSSSQVWLEAGPPNQIDSIQAGWAVAPSLFGDDNPRTFMYYSSMTAAGVTTGCFNFLCPGFVQVHQNISAGYILRNISEYDGTAYFFDLQIRQDAAARKWVLTIDGEDIGTWEFDLVPNLARGATFIGWGGLTRSGASGSSPPMGNGYLPKDGAVKKTSAHWNLHYINNQNAWVEPRDLLEFVTQVDNRQCYDLNYEAFRDEQLRFTLLFGGPGGSQC